MASQTDICNLALSFLGAAPITSLLDQSTSARVLNAEYSFVRDAELRNHTWRFAIRRASLAASTETIASGPFSTCFYLPQDCLKVLMVGDSYPGYDQSDYRTAPTDAWYLIEDNKILCDLGSPLSLRYVSRITTEGTWDSSFCIAMAAMLAWKCCERITQSAEKRKLAMTEYNQAIMAGARANAIEHPPEAAADDTWILSRMQ